MVGNQYIFTLYLKILRLTFTLRKVFHRYTKLILGRLATETDPFELDLSSLDEYNSWVATNIQEVFKSKQLEAATQKDDENARFLTLFRLLTIKYRADNPLTSVQNKKLLVKIQRVLSHTLIGSLEEFFMSLK